MVRLLVACDSMQVHGHRPAHSAALRIAIIASRIAGGSADQDSINWASSGSIGAFSSPSAPHSAVLTKTESRNMLPNRWLEESARLPSTSGSGFRTLVHLPATPLQHRELFHLREISLRPRAGLNGNHVLVARFSTLVDRTGNRSESSSPDSVASGTGPSE